MELEASTLSLMTSVTYEFYPGEEQKCKALKLNNYLGNNCRGTLFGKSIPSSFDLV